MLHSSSIIFRPPYYSSSPAKTSAPAATPSSFPSLLPFKFPTSHHDNLRYLNSIGIINSDTKTKTKTKTPSPERLHQIISTVNFLKSHGFSDSHFPRLAYHIPQIFSPDFDPSDIEPVFAFLRTELPASEQESCALIHFCPQILLSHVQFCLNPTLRYLREEIGVRNLNSPTKLNAHLLNTRVQKLEEKVRFLRDVGFSAEESATICARFPAVFGYGIEKNLLPKMEYLVDEMGRRIGEVNGFPQYFGFSLEKRIIPRHLHLKKRNVKLDLQRMLLWSDKKFYAKWK